MIKINVTAGHCEQFEQKCQVSLEGVLRYSERRLVEGEACVVCSIIPVEHSGYMTFFLPIWLGKLLFLFIFHKACGQELEQDWFRNLVTAS